MSKYLHRAGYIPLSFLEISTCLLNKINLVIETGGNKNTGKLALLYEWEVLHPMDK
jgi:hypothetical protein